MAQACIVFRTHSSRPFCKFWKIHSCIRQKKEKKKRKKEKEKLNTLLEKKRVENLYGRGTSLSISL
jgi:hypothetical protein